MDRGMRQVTVLLAVVVLTGCGRSCVWRPGGATEEQEIEDAMSETPECRKIRSKERGCTSGSFDVKWSCGPNEGECIASARARLACALAIPGNYECQREGNGSFVGAAIPDECRRFGHLCTGVDRATTIVDAGSAEPAP